MSKAFQPEGSEKRLSSGLTGSAALTAGKLPALRIAGAGRAGKLTVARL
jgi:hypothetical protein